MAFRSLFHGLAAASIFLSQFPSANAAFWTVTRTSVFSVSTITNDDGGFRYSYTDLYPIRSGATPTKSALTTSTYTNTEDDIEFAIITYPTGAVADSDIVKTTTAPRTGASHMTMTHYFVDVVYTAPISCTSSFNFSTAIRVSPPYAVTDQLIPASVVTTTASTTYSNGYAEDNVYVYLPSSAYPLKTATEMYYSEYIVHCATPFSPSKSKSASTSDRSFTREWKSLAIWMVIVALMVPSFLLLRFT